MAKKPTCSPLLRNTYLRKQNKDNTLFLKDICIYLFCRFPNLLHHLVWNLLQVSLSCSHKMTSLQRRVPEIKLRNIPPTIQAWNPTIITDHGYYWYTSSLQDVYFPGSNTRLKTDWHVSSSVNKNYLPSILIVSISFNSLKTLLQRSVSPIPNM